MEDKQLNLATMAAMFADETKAREWLESKLWPDGPVCPHDGCGCMDVYDLAKTRSGLYKCKACRKQFTVRIGTIMEESKIPICKWLMAVHLMTSSKKGVSSHQIARECGITQKSAWFMNHRIREAMKQEPMAGFLSGTVEVDETYVGGKPRKGDGKIHKRGRGTDKQPVMVLVERDGDGVHCKPIDKVDGKTLKGEIAVNVAKESVIMTDENSSYRGVGADFDGGHETVNHSAGEYARKNDDGLNVHTNTAESFFALLKRGHYGIFHQLSKKHLFRYCNEFGFRWRADGRRYSRHQREATNVRLACWLLETKKRRNNGSKNPKFVCGES
jgi:transposase-like protein